MEIRRSFRILQYIQNNTYMIFWFWDHQRIIQIIIKCLTNNNSAPKSIKYKISTYRALYQIQVLIIRSRNRSIHPKTPTVDQNVLSH